MQKDHKHILICFALLTSQAMMNTLSTYNVIATLHDYELMCRKVENGSDDLDYVWVIWVTSHMKQKYLDDPGSIYK